MDVHLETTFEGESESWASASISQGSIDSLEAAMQGESHFMTIWMSKVFGCVALCLGGCKSSNGCYACSIGLCEAKASLHGLTCIMRQHSWMDAPLASASPIVAVENFASPISLPTAAAVKLDLVKQCIHFYAHAKVCHANVFTLVCPVDFDQITDSAFY